MSGKPVRLGRKFDRQAGCLGPLHPLLCLVLSQELCTSFSLCLAPPLGLWMADSSFSSQRNIATSEKPPRVAGSHIRGSMSFVAELSPISGSPHLLLGPHVCCLSPQWLPHFYWALSKSCSLGAQYVAHMDFIHGCVRLGHVRPPGSYCGGGSAGPHVWQVAGVLDDRLNRVVWTLRPRVGAVSLPGGL